MIGRKSKATQYRVNRDFLSLGLILPVRKVSCGDAIQGNRLPDDLGWLSMLLLVTPRLLGVLETASPDKEAFLFTVVIRYWHFQILCPLDIPFETSSLDCCWEIQLAASQLCLCFRFLLSIERTIVAQDTKGESSLPFFPLMTRSRFGH